MMFADILWWVMMAAAMLGFVAAVVECIIVLEFIHTGRIPHVFAQEYKVSTSVFIGVNILQIIALLLFFLFPQFLNILYETRTFLVWMYVSVLNALLIVSYSLPVLRDLRSLLGMPHKVEESKIEAKTRTMYVSYVGMMVAHSTVLLISFFKIFDQIPSPHILAFLLTITMLSGVMMPFLYRLRVSLKNNL